ncbi:hypothetical protein BHE74_00043443 [Ensete ventricosum]|nr:hypothetical protein BHE74_00043443 [Ensete ventricosum]RZR99668.1 hypothetical protein BHM03_00029274 [Ensete ventricosum]
MQGRLAIGQATCRYSLAARLRLGAPMVVSRVGKSTLAHKGGCLWPRTPTEAASCTNAQSPMGQVATRIHGGAHLQGWPHEGSHLWA